MLSRVYANQPIQQEQSIQPQEYQVESINTTQIHRSFYYYNPITFLFPELLNKGKVDLDRTLNYSAILLQIILKLIIIMVTIFELWESHYLVIVLSLNASDFWLNKNWSARSLIGMTWWVEVDEITDCYYFERISKIYPLNKSGVVYFWYSLYTYMIILVTLMGITIYRQQYNQTLILLFPMTYTYVNILLFTLACETTESETYKYLEELTTHRMRRSIKHHLQFKYYTKLQLSF